MTANLRKRIGERIRRAREQSGLTQAELGQRLGKNTTTVSNYENGNRLISVTELPTLAQVLQVPITFFFETEAELTDHLLEALEQQRPLDDDLLQELITLLTTYLREVSAMRTDLSTVFAEIDDLKGQLAGQTPEVATSPARRRLLTFTVEEASLKSLLEMLVEQKYIRLGADDASD